MSCRALPYCFARNWLCWTVFFQNFVVHSLILDSKLMLAGWQIYGWMLRLSECKSWLWLFAFKTQNLAVSTCLWIKCIHEIETGRWSGSAEMWCGYLDLQLRLLLPISLALLVDLVILTSRIFPFQTRFPLTYVCWNVSSVTIIAVMLISIWA